MVTLLTSRFNPKIIDSAHRLHLSLVSLSERWPRSTQGCTADDDDDDDDENDEGRSQKKKVVSLHSIKCFFITETGCRHCAL